MSEINAEVALEKIVASYTRYYDIAKSDGKPFVATAEFHSRGEEFFLTKSAVIGESESHEFVFFAIVDFLNDEQLKKFAEKSWECGLKKTRVKYGNQNTDITLVICANEIADEAKCFTKKYRKRKNYWLGFCGWNDARLILCEAKTKNFFCNKLGNEVKIFLEKKLT